MTNTVLRGVTLADGTATDVRFDAATVLEIGVGIGTADDTSIDMRGWTLLPAAVEPHAHLDKAFLAELIENPTGDLIGAVEAMEASRHLITHESIVARAERAARLMAERGYVAVRTHADVTLESGLVNVIALDEVRRRVAGLVDVQIVALAGWPVTGLEGASQRSLLRAALDAGADLVGGCPHLETLVGGDVRAATDVLLEIASDRDRDADLHTDETLDPTIGGLEHLARRVQEGFPGRVTASHCVSLGVQSEDQQRAIAGEVAAAGIGVVALPHTNLFLQGRHHQAAMPRGLTAVRALRNAGVVVAAGADNLQDPFNPLGRACPFETAGLMVLAAHVRPIEAWHMVSAAAHAALGRRGGSIEVGSPADLLAVGAASLRSAIAEGPLERRVWRAARSSRHASSVETDCSR